MLGPVETIIALTEVLMVSIISACCVFGKKNKKFRDPGMWLLLTGAISFIFSPMILFFAVTGAVFLRDVWHISMRW